MTVWLVISSYRNDEEIARILERVHASGETVFEKILIVDSEGTGTIPALVERRGWSRVIYRSYQQNLGSGANLRERLRIAAEGRADYAYAVNHDGYVDAEIVGALLRAAQQIGNLGAAYPLCHLVNADRYDMTGIRELPLPAKLARKAPSGPLVDVFWGRSNGVLYALAPAKQGILPWNAMWMAYEDLEYGWRLHDHGYRQVIVCDAVFHDTYEYRPTALGYVINKPTWRTYYNMRNLILAIRHTRNRPLYHATGALRFVMEFWVIVLLRRNKWRRLRMLWAGAIDGIRGVEEKQPSLDYSSA